MGKKTTVIGTRFINDVEDIKKKKKGTIRGSFEICQERLEKR